MPAPRKLVQSRPAETGGVAGAAALLIGHALGITDPDTLVAIGMVIGCAPAAITWLVTTVRGR